MTRALVVAIFAGLAAGCGDSAVPLPESVEVSGTVAYADGKPVQNVQLVLRPKGEGHLAGCPLGPDGKFSVKAIPGEYMFFFQPSEAKGMENAKGKSAFAAIPTKYQEASMDRTVNLSAGDGNEIKLD